MCPLVGVVGVWVVRRGAGARQLELLQGLHTSHSLMGEGWGGEGGRGEGRGGEGRGREGRAGEGRGGREGRGGEGTGGEGRGGEGTGGEGREGVGEVRGCTYIHTLHILSHYVHSYIHTPHAHSPTSGYTPTLPYQTHLVLVQSEVPSVSLWVWPHLGAH